VSPLILALLAMIAVGAVGLALVPAMTGGSRAGKRIKALQGDLQVNRRTNELERQRENRRKSVQQVLKTQTQAQKQRKRVPLPQQLQQAGMKLSPVAFIRNSAILGAAVFVVCFLLEVPLLFAAVFAAAAGYLLPRFYLKRRTRKYQDKFLDELPNAVEAIVRGVRSGLPLNDSLKVVAREAKEPVRSEFARVLDQQAFGMSITDAIAVLNERVPVPEVNFFVVVISVQQQAGGNLSEALGNLARVLRNRKKMQAKVKAMSAEAKASAMIIGSLPFVVAGLVSVVSPSYLAPLVSTPTGYFWLGVAALMMSFGVFIMNRMIQFDY